MVRLTSACLLAAAAICTSSAAHDAAGPTRVWQPEDVAALRAVGDPQIAPDGASVVYTTENIDLGKDKRFTHLWLVQWDGSENHALTSGEATESHPRWSPDGKRLAFLSHRGDEHEDDQLWILPLAAGGEAEKITDQRGGVSDFAWSPDGERLVLVGQDPDPRDPEGHEKDKKTVPPLVIDRYQFKQDIEGYLTAQHPHLRLLDLATRRVEPLTDPKAPYDELLPAWSPDGKEIAFVTKRGEDPDRTENWDIYVVPAQPGASGKERQVTTAPEADAHPTAECAPAWSPDGKAIAYLHGGDPKKIEYATTTLAVSPAAGGEARILTRRLDRNILQPHWSADGRDIHFIYEDDRAQSLARVPAESSDATPETLVGGRRKVDAYSSARDGRTVVLAGTTDRPNEIFAVDHDAEDGLRCLSKQNDPLLAQIRVARTEDTSFKSADGTEVHGFVVHPIDEPAGGKGPALLRPHGGPSSQYAYEFSFETQLFAAHGYAVILPNPRGSTGRGEAYGMGIYAAWGSVDVRDDLAAVDDAVARGVADPENLGVGGWSYGGMSTNYLIASTPRFKAATSGASIANILAGYGTDEYIRDYEAELGPPWANLDKWMGISYPFYHADRIKTPTLFLCGASDFNVPLPNSEQMYQALRTLKVPTELVIYPGQFHGLKMPSYLVDRAHRYLDWYAKWMGKGK